VTGTQMSVAVFGLVAPWHAHQLAGGWLSGNESEPH
jgi:hypothetical protein